MGENNRGFWIVATMAAVIAAGTYLGADSRCQSQQDVYRADASEHPGRYEVSQFAFDRRWLPCLLERGTANNQTQEASQKEERDLIAQESMSVWAFWALNVAALQLIATILGLILIRGTLQATRDAVKEAGTATQAAIMTANAYIAVERPKLIPSVGSCYLDDMSKRIVVNMKAENIGKSTGHVHTIAMGWAANNAPPSNVLMLQKPASKAVHEKETSVVGKVNSAPDAQKFPFIVGWFVYRSAFKEDHVSFFCVRVEDHPRDAFGEGGPTAIDFHKGDGLKGEKWPQDT